MCMTTLISKLPLLFVTSDKGQVYQVDISSSLGKLTSSSSSTSSLSEPSSLSSSDVGGEGEEATMKPSMTACCRAIRPTWVFTWHNSSLRVSRRASICTICAMMASSVTLPTEDEGAVEAGGATISVCVHLGRSWASLRLTLAASMAPMMKKWSDGGKETEKWRRILVIVEGKMSLSRVTVSL